MRLLPLIHRGMAWIAGSTWPKKISRSLIFLIIFLSCSQLGSHFWPASAFVYGIRVDYLSPTLYLLDLLIIIYLGIYRFKNLIKILNSKLNIIFPILLVNLIFSQNPWASLNWSFHFSLYLIFILSLSRQVLSTMYYALFTSLIFQLFLGSWQVITGHSLQGVFYYFGERMLSVGQPNVAVASFMGSLVLRAYGTFSHPNILAGFSVVSTLIIYRLAQSRLTATLVTIITSLIILLTQSRAAALAFFALVILFHFFTSLRFRIIYFAFLLIPISIMLKANLLTRSLDLSAGQRLSLQQVSARVISAYPLFGVGASAAITRYPDLVPNFRLLQPDHNSFTLFFSWFGVFGILSFYFVLKPKSHNLKAIFPLLPLLLFDHYLLTSIQGLFVLLLYLKVLKIDKLKIQ